jgi:peptidoglycan/LPS O-acetylase OafA/YrhL
LSEPASNRHVPSRVAYLALAAAAIGVFLPWTQDGPVHLDGLDGPNNGWLVLIVAGIALCWMRSMGRGSLVASAAVCGSALVIGLTAVNDWVDGRRVLDATGAYGVMIVVGASVILAAAAAIHIPRPRQARHRGSAP